MPGQGSSPVLLATKERPRSPWSSTWQFVVHLQRSLWIERCTSLVWKKISKVLVQVGFPKQRVCLGLFTLHSPVGVLNGVICLHVDDMLGTGDDVFESKMEELDKVVGLGSVQRQKFDHCGRQCEKHAAGEITISMKAYTQNLKMASLTRDRTKHFDDELSATESHEFRGVNGCLQWVNEGVTLSLPVRRESSATEARTGSRSRRAQSK